MNTFLRQVFFSTLAVMFPNIGISAAWAQCSFPPGPSVRPTDLGSQDQYGSSIAIDGNVAFLGAPRQPNATDKGAVYVATHGASWLIGQKLVASDGATGHQFGKAVAVKGTWAVVGAPGNGAAYVYQLTGSTWTFRQKLIPSPGMPGDFFGSSAAIAEDTMVIGAYGRTSYSGQIFVFKYNGTSWEQSQVLNAFDGASYDFFGYAVGISNNFMVVGAYGDDEPAGTNFGSSYVFKFTGAEWVFHQKLQAPNGKSGDNFGESVAIDGEKMVIGASRDDDGGSNAGAAYLFGIEGTQWGFKQKITGSDSTAGYWFGSSVAILGNLALVGTPFWGNDSGVTKLGAVYPFLFDGSSWNEQDKLLAASGSFDDSFGNAVALTSSTIVVGASLHDYLGRDTGNAYFFGIQCNIQTTMSASSPPNGYVDPREDRDATTGALLGIKNVSITFSEPVFDQFSGGELSLDNFQIHCSKNNAPVSDLQTGLVPMVTQVTKTGASSYELQLSRRICLGAWTEIAAIEVKNSSGTVISNTENKVVLGFLPMDITQDGNVLGDDIDHWHTINYHPNDPEPLTKLQLLDQKRNGAVTGEDITRGIQLMNGNGTFQAWSGLNLGPRP